MDQQSGNDLNVLINANNSPVLVSLADLISSGSSQAQNQTNQTAPDQNKQQIVVPVRISIFVTSGDNPQFSRIHDQVQLQGDEKLWIFDISEYMPYVPYDYDRFDNVFQVPRLVECSVEDKPKPRFPQQFAAQVVFSLPANATTSVLGLARSSNVIRLNLTDRDIVGFGQNDTLLVSQGQGQNQSSCDVSNVEGLNGILSEDQQDESAFQRLRVLNVSLDFKFIDVLILFSASNASFNGIREIKGIPAEYWVQRLEDRVIEYFYLPQGWTYNPSSGGQAVDAADTQLLLQAVVHSLPTVPANLSGEPLQLGQQLQQLENATAESNQLSIDIVRIYEFFDWQGLSQEQDMFSIRNCNGSQGGGDQQTTSTASSPTETATPTTETSTQTAAARRAVRGFGFF